MKTNISETTDNEIQDIIEKLKAQGYYQEDEACMRIETPFVINPDLNEDRKNRIFLVFYPELLSYFVRERNPRKVGFVTVPWICAKFSILGPREFDEDFHRELCKWTVELMKGIGLNPFKDEDAYVGHFSKNKTREEEVEFKMYINPDFPEGYWANHTL